MATTPVTLKIDGFKDREVARISYAFEQSTDKENQPAGIPRGGKIELVVKAMNDGNEELLSWMLDSTMFKKGKVVFMNTTENKLMKEIQFEKAYCVDFLEVWEDTTKDAALAHYEKIILSCGVIKNGGVSFQNEWK